MGQYERTQAVGVPADDLFDLLTDVRNLPTFMDRMTSAELAGPGEVTVTALIDPDGDGPEPEREVKGTAWFELDKPARTMRWGSEGPNDYHGTLEVTGDELSCRVRVELHTERADGPAVEESLERTMTSLRRVAERR